MPLHESAVDFLGPVLNYIGGRESRATQEELFDKNLAWTEMMSNTAVRRHTSDMRAAGLNPILAAGGSASTPGPPSFDPKNLMEGAVSSAVDIKRLKAEVKERQSRVNLQNAQAGVAESTKKSIDATLPRKNIIEEFFGSIGEPSVAAFKALLKRMGRTETGEFWKFKTKEELKR